MTDTFRVMTAAASAVLLIGAWTGPALAETAADEPARDSAAESTSSPDPQPSPDPEPAPDPKPKTEPSKTPDPASKPSEEPPSDAQPTPDHAVEGVDPADDPSGPSESESLVAADDAYTVDVGTTQTLDVLDNDSAPPGAILEVVREPALGTVALSDDKRTIEYTAGPSDDEFAYAVVSDEVRSRAATVTITVPPPMTSRQLAIAAAAPFSRDDTYSTSPGEVLTVPAPGVLANDDFFITSLFTVQEGSASNGIVNANDDGSFTYTPDSGFAGIDSFQYRVINDDGTGNWATVRISVQDAPDAVADAYTIPATGTLTVDAPGLLGNDANVDGATVTLVSANTGPTIDVDDDGSFTYTTGPTPFPLDSFTYRVTTPSGTDTATVTVSLSPPVLEDDFYQVDAGGTLAVGAPGILSNDVVSPSAAPILSTGPSHGSLTLGPDGSFDYTPEADFVGSDSFTYAFANIAGADTATVTIAVGTPLAVDDAYSTKRGATLVVAPPGVLSNDSADAGDVQLGTDLTEHGTLSLNADGSFTYVPDVSFTGADTFSYVTAGTAAASNEATVTITVTPAPVAVDDAYSTGPDETLFVNASDGLLGNDIGASTVAGSSYTGSGALGINNDGSFFYDPPNGFSGTDTFTYTASGPDGTSAPATVTITVIPDPPAAVDDSYSTPAGTTLTVSAPGNGVLGNDTNATSVALDTDVDHGTLTLSTDGTFTYTPDSGFTGTDTFTYTATGPGGTTEPATATITVTGLAAADDSFTTPQETLLFLTSADLIANDTVDGGPCAGCAITIASQPSHGTVIEVDLDPSGGPYHYRPHAGFYGTDSFTYTVTTSAGTSAPATVTITVTPASPVAVDDRYSTPAGTTLTVSAPGDGVLGNDTNATSVALDTDVDHGTLTLSTDGTFTYTPDSEFTGTDTFTYTATGPGGTTTPATVTITVTVTGVVAADDSFTTPQETLLFLTSADLIANDTVDGGPCAGCTITIASQPSHGTVIDVDLDPSGGPYHYRPHAGFYGTDSFTYTVTTSAGTSAPATVTITVTPTTTAPVAVDDSYEVPSTGLLAVDAPGVMVNDLNTTDATAELVSGPTNGIFTFNPDGSFSYTSLAPLSDSFTYRLDGPGGESNTATVTLTRPPPMLDAIDDAYDVDAGDVLQVDDPGFLGNDTGSGIPQIVDLPTHGELVPTGGGGFTYTPDQGYVGTDTFTYSLTNPIGGLTDTATVTITVQAVAAAPIGQDDSYDVDENETLTVDAPGVLGNDVGATGARLVSGTDHGSLDFDEDGSFSYTPDEDFTGTDEFVYVATNDVEIGRLGRSVGGLFALDSQPTTVTLTVVADPRERDDDDDDSDRGDSGDDSTGSRDSGEPDDGTLPNTGSAVHPAHLMVAVLLTVTGGLLIARTRRRGEHIA